MNSESILIVNIRRHRTGGEVVYVCAKSNSGNDGNARHWASVDFVFPVRGYINVDFRDSFCPGLFFLSFSVLPFLLVVSLLGFALRSAPFFLFLSMFLVPCYLFRSLLLSCFFFALPCFLFLVFFSLFPFPCFIFSLRSCFLFLAGAFLALCLYIFFFLR